MSKLPPKSSSPAPRRPAPDTLAVHAGEVRPRAHDSLTTPIIATSTYTFESTEELCRYFDGKYEREEYGRYGNPTVRTAEQKIAALDGAEDAALFASGMAAFTTTLLALLKSGDHVIMTSDCYRRSRQFVGTVLKRYGVTSTLVPPGDYAALEAAITPTTKLIIAESGNFPDIAQFYQDEVMGPGDELFAKVLARGVARGEFRNAPTNPTTTLICAPLVFLMLWRSAFAQVNVAVIDPAAFVDQLIQVLLFGLTAGPARDTPLPPPDGPFVWERIRDELLAERAAAQSDKNAGQERGT